MTRNVLNLVIDVVTFVALMVVGVTGLLMKFVLPSGSPRLGLALFGWDRHDWGAFHFWATVGLGVILVLHLALHWQWVCTTIGRMVMGRRRQARMGALERNVVGVAWLVIVVGVTAGLLGGAKMLVQQGASEGEGGGGRHRGAAASVAPSGEVAMEEGAGMRRRAGRAGE